MFEYGVKLSDGLWTFLVEREVPVDAEAEREGEDVDGVDVDVDRSSSVPEREKEECLDFLLWRLNGRREVTLTILLLVRYGFGLRHRKEEGKEGVLVAY